MEGSETREPKRAKTYDADLMTDMDEYQTAALQDIYDGENVFLETAIP